MGGPLTGHDATPAVPPDGSASARRLELWARMALCAVLVGSWAVMVAYMWDALTTVPGADRLDVSRMLVIPTSRTFFAATAFSALELAVVLAVLWPWRPSYYAARLAVAILALATWFTITTPLGVSRMDWVHRRWLFFLILATGSALAVNLAYQLGRRLRRRA
jgi:hypothetical protein